MGRCVRIVEDWLTINLSTMFPAEIMCGCISGRTRRTWGVTRHHTLPRIISMCIWKRVRMNCLFTLSGLVSGRNANVCRCICRFERGMDVDEGER